MLRPKLFLWLRLKKALIHSESAKRSLIKAVTYRVVIIISIFLIALITTNDYSATFKITFITAISGTILYYLHERAWSLIRWGRK